MINSTDVDLKTAETEQEKLRLLIILQKSK